MARDLTLNIIGDQRDADKALAATARGLDKLANKVDSTSASFKGYSKQVDESAKKTREQLEDHQHLQGQIRDTGKRMEDLARQINRTSDEAEKNNLFKTLNKESANLRRLKKLDALLPKPADLASAGKKAGQEIGAGINGGLSESLRALGPVGKSFAIGIGLQIASVAGPFVTAAVAGAITAGVGLGIAGLGAAIAAQDNRVKAAAHSLADTVKAEFTAAAEPMVQPLVRSLGKLETAGAALAPQFRELFAASAPGLEKFTDGLIGLVNNIMPGLRKAVFAAGPVIERLAADLPGLGSSISKFFRDVAQSQGAVDGLSDLVKALGAFIETAGFAIEAGSNMYAIFRDLVTLDFGGIADTVTGTQKAMKPLKTETQQVGEAARLAAADIAGFAQAVRDQQRAVLSALNAQIGFEDAIDRAAEAAKNGKKGIDVNTAAGRENKRALLDIAAAAQAYAEQILETSGDTDAATAATERGRKKFLETAAAMKVPKAEAKALADQLFGIPTNIKPKVSVDGKQAKTAIQQIQEKINGLRGRKIPITFQTVLGNSSISLGQLMRAQGGIDYKMAGGGMLSGARGVESHFTRSPTVLYGERGDEAYIARDANPARSRKIWESVGTDWLGMEKQRLPVAGPRMTGAAGGGERVVRIILEGTGVLSGLQTEISARGGNVQQVLGGGRG